MQAMSARPRRSPAFWTLVIGVVSIGFLLLYAGLWTEKLWFDSTDFTNVFLTQLSTRVALFGVGALIMGGSVWLNMWIAYRLRPQSRRRGASAVLDRYRDMLEANLRTALALPALVLGFMAGMSASTQVFGVLAWLNRTPSGTTEPTFGLDTSFFLFDYPILRLATSLLLSALVFGLIAAIAVHFAVGNLVPGNQREALAAAGGAGVHLSVLGGLIVALYGVENLLDRYGLLLDRGTLFTGLHYTDDRARMTAKLVIAIIAFIVALLFFANAFLKRLILPMVGLVLMLVSGLILSFLYPAGVQAFVVTPSQADRERPYIADHIEATRQAYGIDEVDIQEYAAVTKVQPGQLKEDAEALPGIRLMDPDIIGNTFEQLQQVRGYYAFSEVLDIDRYELDGEERDVVVAAREINSANIPDRNWINLHTVYTHGHGLVAAYGNRRQVMGEPEWIVRDIPPVGPIEQTQSRVYYGERSTTFAIVGRAEGQPPVELDSPGGGDGGGEQFYVYTGTGGVEIGNLWRRLLYSARFSDLNILLSDRVNEASKILYDRTPVERVRKVAPWLTTDSNIYPSIVDGRLVWIVDAYTTSDTYPNSERVALQSAVTDTQTQALAPQFDRTINYIRNSVKAVVDAYDGSVTLYAWDETDPVLRAYAAAFPGSVKPKSEISESLLSHLRYPQDLFKVQRDLLARYHMTDPGQWYGGTDLWEVPVDPVKATRGEKEPPYYLSIKWPTDDDPVFSQTSVFVPRNRQNLASYFAVTADAQNPDYGKLRVLRMSDTQQIDGPGQTQNAITQDQAVAQRLLPYQQNRGAASITFGNLLTLPMGNGLLYVEPVYTERAGSAGSYPALTFVVVRFGQHVGIGSTLQEALDEVFQGDAGADTGEEPLPDGQTPPPPGETPTPSAPGPVDEARAVELLQQAQDAFTAADAALRTGDLAEYQQRTEEARRALADALRAMGR